MTLVTNLLGVSESKLEAMAPSTGKEMVNVACLWKGLTHSESETCVHTHIPVANFVI